MLFHRRQDAQIALHPSGVVIMDIGFNHLDKFTFAGEPSAVIAFPLQNTPEALHRAVIDAMRHAGHALRHSCLYELVVESAVGVVLPAGQTVLDDLNALFLCGVPSLLHVASSSGKLD